MVKATKVTNKKILITGGTGFIGSFLTEHFSPDNKVTIFDNGRRNAFKLLAPPIRKNIRVIKGDIRDIKAVRKIVKNQDIIIHLAAIAGASFYEKDPLLTFQVNFFGTANLLESLMGQSIEKLLIFSTSEVYGPQAVNVREDDLTCLGPISQGRWSYAASKVAGDHLAMAYFKKYQLPLNIIRPFNIYGPRQVGEGAVVDMLTDAIEKKKITITGDGKQKRAWCYIDDMVQAVDSVCRQKIVGECFNIGNSAAYGTILDLAKRISVLCGGTKIVFQPSRKAEVMERKPNVQKAQDLLGFTAKVGLNEGLKKTYDWRRQVLG